MREVIYECISSICSSSASQVSLFSGSSPPSKFCRSISFSSACRSSSHVEGSRTGSGGAAVTPNWPSSVLRLSRLIISSPWWKASLANSSGWLWKVNESYGMRTMCGVCVPYPEISWMTKINMFFPSHNFLIYLNFQKQSKCIVHSIIVQLLLTEQTSKNKATLPCCPGTDRCSKLNAVLGTACIQRNHCHTRWHLVRRRHWIKRK